MINHQHVPAEDGAPVCVTECAECLYAVGWSHRCQAQSAIMCSHYHMKDEFVSLVFAYSNGTHFEKVIDLTTPETPNQGQSEPGQPKTE